MNHILCLKSTLAQTPIANEKEAARPGPRPSSDSLIAQPPGEHSYSLEPQTQPLARG